MKLELPPEIEVCWPCYRLVIERRATWGDLKTMTIDDVDKLCMAIDEWQAAEQRAREE